MIFHLVFERSSMRMYLEELKIYSGDHRMHWGNLGVYLGDGGVLGTYWEESGRSSMAKR